LLAVLRHGELASGLAQRHPVFLFPTLLMGMALGFLFQRQRRVPQGLKPDSLSGQKVEAEASTYPEAKPEPTAKRMPSLLTLVGLAGLVAMTLNVGRIDRWAPHVMFYLPAIAAVLYGLALGGWPARLLRVRPLLILGDSVYAFYLTQIPLGCTVVWIAGGFGRRDVFDLRSAPPFSQRPAFYFVVLACDLVLSVLLFRFFETPWRVRLRRVLGERWLHKPLPPPIIPGQSAAQTSGQQT
jgi:peptidoglycan/LPS O-acetylase OafA/YrhL